MKKNILGRKPIKYAIQESMGIVDFDGKEILARGRTTRLSSWLGGMCSVPE